MRAGPCVVRLCRSTEYRARASRLSMGPLVGLHVCASDKKLWREEGVVAAASGLPPPCGEAEICNPALFAGEANFGWGQLHRCTEPHPKSRTRFPPPRKGEVAMTALIDGCEGFTGRTRERHAHDGAISRDQG